MAYSAALRALLKGQGYSDAEIDAMEAEAAASTAKTPAKTPITKTYYPQVFSPTKARAFINDQFQALFKRDATSAEISKYTKLLKNVQEKNASAGITNYTTKGSTATSKTITGLDEAQWFLEEIQKDKVLAAEYKSVKTAAPEITKLAADKKIYEDLIKAAGNDPEKIKAAKNTTTYGRSIDSMQKQIARLALAAGAQFSDEELAAIAQEAIDTAVNTDKESLTAFINSKMNFKSGAKGAYTGAAGENVDALTKVAAANGLDLNKAFGAQLPDWLSAINKGESIDTFKKIIRDVAKIGMPEKVAKLIDQGVDLSTIYAPYKNIMASTLEINPQTISLDDPTLRSAITADAEIPIYEFERQLRNDNRWQYTNQAKEEVSNATMKILQDFGFMG